MIRTSVPAVVIWLLSALFEPVLVPGAVAQDGNVWRELLDRRASADVADRRHGPSKASEPRATSGPRDNVWAALRERLRRERSASPLDPFPGMANLHGALEHWARHYAIPVHYLAAIMSVESNRYDPCSTSHSGAQGLLQLMPGTARYVGVADPYRPAEAVRGGAAYLSEALAASGGDPELAAAYYNFGPRALITPRQSWPEETRRYVDDRLPAALRQMKGGGWREYVPARVTDVDRGDCEYRVPTE